MARCFHVLICCLWASVAQSQQFWPKIDTYVTLNSNVRIYLTASQTRESGTSTDAEIGPNVDIFLKPLLRLQRITRFQLDQSESRLLLLRFGYRYLPSTQGPTENRIVMEATPNFPLKANILLSDRNRADVRFMARSVSWRYRNRLTLERTLSIRAYHFTPYLRGEVYYDSNSARWSRTALDAGGRFPIRKHTEIEPYFEHQNDTSQIPNRQVTALGLSLNLYF